MNKVIIQHLLVLFINSSVFNAVAQNCMITFEQIQSVVPLSASQVTVNLSPADPVPNSNSSSSSFNVSYTAGFQYRAVSSGTWITVENYSTSAVVSFLSPGTSYEFRAYTNAFCEQNDFDPPAYNSWNDNDVSGSSSALTYPAAPTLSTASSSNATSVTLAWNGVSGTVSGYKVDLSTNSGMGSGVSTFAVGTSPTTLTTANTLTPGTNYYYRVRAVNATGESTSSAISSAVITRPAAPVNNAASNMTTTTFKANWQTTNSAVTYRLDVSASSSFNPLTSGYNDLTVNGTSQDVINLSAGTQYYYRVRAVNASGASVSSTTSSLITLPVAPTLDQPSISANSFTARWQAPTGATGYRIDVSTDNNFGSFLSGYNNRTVAGTSQDVTGLTAGTQYYYRVRAVNANGGVSANAASPVTTSLGGPTATAASTISTTSFNANWLASSGATSYRLDVSTSESFDSFLPGFNDKTVNAITASVSGLTAGTTYYYRVRSINAGGASVNSNTISLVTIPQAPLASNSSDIGLTSFKANWQAALGSSSYRLDVTNDNFANLLVGYNDLQVTGTNQDVTGLLPGTTYSYRVRATNGSGTSTNSNVINQITKSEAPSLQPSTNITTTSFVINWATAIGASSYEIDVSDEVSFNRPAVGYDKLSVSGTMQNVTDLVAGRKYYYRVRSVNAAGVSDNSAVGNLFTLPAIPPDFVPAEKAATSIKVQWQPVASASSYELEVSTRLDFSALVPNYDPKIIPSVITEQIVTGLLPSTVYYFRVRARNATGVSDYSAVKSSNTLSSSGSDEFELKLTEAPSYPDKHLKDEFQELSISIRGGNGIVSVYLYHKKNASAVFARETLTKVGNDFKMAVADSWFDEFGMEFYFEAIDEGNQTKQSLHHTILSQVEVNMPTTNFSFGKEIKNYQLISIPYSLLESNQINTAFEKVMGVYDTKKWRLSQYRNGKIVDWTEGLSANQLVQGQSYFFISKSPVDLNFGDGKNFGNTFAKPFKMNLKKGWNQIGNPFPYTLSWHEILTANNNPTGVDNLLTFNQETVSFIEDDMLKVFGGGFVFTENDIELNFPVTLSNSNGRTKINDDSFAEGEEVSDSNWILPIELVQGEVVNKRSAIGMKSGSVEAKDQWDRIAAPRLFRYLEFTTSQSGYEYDLARSIVNPQDKFTWSYAVHSDEAGSIELKWDNNRVTNLDGQLILHDLTKDVLLDMVKVNSYVTDQSGKFLMYYLKEKSIGIDQVNLGIPYPNPFQSQLIIPFDYAITTLGENKATLSIADLHGRVVVKINVNDQINEQGIQYIQWNGLTSDGNTIPSGIYVYQLTVAGNNTTKIYRGKVTKN